MSQRSRRHLALSVALFLVTLVASAPIVIAAWKNRVRPVDQVEARLASLRRQTIEAYVNRKASISTTDPTTGDEDNSERATHEVKARIDVRCVDGSGSIQHLCLDSKGRCVAAVGSSRLDVLANRARLSELQLFDREGGRIKTTPLSFAAHAVCLAPDGTLFAAGSGHVAELTPDADLIRTTRFQNLEAEQQDEKKLLKRAGSARAAMIAERRRYLKALDNRLRLKLQIEDARSEGREITEEEIEDDDLTVDRRFAASSQIREAIDETLNEIETLEKRSDESFISDYLGKASSVHAICADARRLFVCLADPNGFGYEITRFDRTSGEYRTVVTALSGCCGQCDVQCDGNRLIVAENTRHRVALFSLDGERLSTFGRRGRIGVGDEFTSCCNPMNVAAAGDFIYAAQSTGEIKRFTKSGRFVDVVVYGAFPAGCKNAAFAVGSSGEFLFSLDYLKSEIVLFERIEKPLGL